MKTKLYQVFSGYTLLAVLVAACIAPSPQPIAHTSTTPAASGIDPTLPQARSVLWQQCTDQQCELQLIDPATGQPLPAYPPFMLGNSPVIKHSPHRRTLAVIDYPNNQDLTGGRLKFIDLSTWQVITTTLTFDNVYDSFLFSPDGKRLVVYFPKYSWPPGKELRVIDIAQRRLIADRELDFSPRQICFSLDGQWLLIYGIDGSLEYTVNPQARVAILRSTDLQIVWQQILPGIRDGLFNPNPNISPHENPEHTTLWEPAAVFAPDGTHLYLVHADENRLTTVDFAARTVQTVTITQAASWMERLLVLTAHPAKAKVFNGTTKQAAIAPDGKQLYVATLEHIFKDNTYTEIAQNVQVIDVTSGAEIAQIASHARAITVAPDGTRLYLAGWENDLARPDPNEWTEIFSTAPLQRVAKLQDRAIALGQRLDGTPILLSTLIGQDGRWEAATFDPQSLQLIHVWTQQQSSEWGVFITQ
ncbi:MAG: hypothetical protein U0350_44215 [Caldilineaceae bacterium]